MPWETRDNTGSLFRNDRKEEEAHADYRGEARIDGVDYWMNGWLKESAKGTKWMSFSFKRKEKQASSKPGLRVVGGNDGKPPYNDEIPF